MKIVQPLNFDRSYFDVNDAPGGDIALVPYLPSMRVWKTDSVSGGLVVNGQGTKPNTSKAVNVAFAPVFSSSTGLLHHFVVEVFCDTSLTAGQLAFLNANKQYVPLEMNLNIYEIYRQIVINSDSGIAGLQPAPPNASVFLNADGSHIALDSVTAVYVPEIRGLHYTLNYLQQANRTAEFNYTAANNSTGSVKGMLYPYSDNITKLKVNNNGTLKSSNCDHSAVFKHVLVNPSNLTMAMNIGSSYSTASPTPMFLEPLRVSFGASFKLLVRALSLI